MDETEVERHSEMYRRVVARAWADPAFKAKLLADPIAALAAMGIPVLPGKMVRVVENTDQVVHLVLPQRPGGDELSDAELETAAGGVVMHALLPAV